MTKFIPGRVDRQDAIDSIEVVLKDLKRAYRMGSMDAHDFLVDKERIDRWICELHNAKEALSDA